MPTGKLLNWYSPALPVSAVWEVFVFGSVMVTGCARDDCAGLVRDCATDCAGSDLSLNGDCAERQEDYGYFKQATKLK